MKVLARPDAAVADSDLLTLGCFEGQLDELLADQGFEPQVKARLAALAASEGFAGKEGELFYLHGRDDCPNIAIFGLGLRREFRLPDTRRYGARVAAEAERRRHGQVCLRLPPVDGSAYGAAASFAVEGLVLGRYRFDRHRSEASPQYVEQVNVCADVPLAALTRAKVVAEAVVFARDLVNEPACELTPRAMADRARELAKTHQLDCRLLGPKECERLGMSLFLAVGRASEEEPRLIHLSYRPRGKDPAKRRIALIGKGITFDSGGLSLKPTAGMLDMKSDMAGAAAVLGVASLLAPLGIAAEVDVIVPAAENMVSGRAYRLGDIITAMNGKSVEIVNTDAEGRLTLADALVYAQRHSPTELIDVATLTGACRVALGPDIAGVMGNDSAMVERYLAAAGRVGEQGWHLPLPKPLKKQLKSEVADLRNAGERLGGALTAGLFLKEFVGDLPWLHLDIAGPAMTSAASELGPKGATGFAVLSLIEYLSRWGTP